MTDKTQSIEPIRTIDAIQNELIDQFTLFDDWTERYQMLISLGKSTVNFPESKRTDQYLIRGCQSNVWFDIQHVDGKLHLLGTSDAAIVAGLVALLIKLYDRQSPQNILKNLPPKLIKEIGFEGHLSPTRQTGLYAMLGVIEKAAKSVA